MVTDRKGNRLMGWSCIAMGLLPLAIASGLIEPEPGSIIAPKWVTGICGAVFVVAGLAILSGPGKKLNHVFAAVILLIFTAISAWVAFFGPSEGFSGGIPFLPHDVNVKIARWIFAGGSVICLLIFFYTLSQIRQPRSESKQVPEP